MTKPLDENRYFDEEIKFNEDESRKVIYKNSILIKGGYTILSLKTLFIIYCVFCLGKTKIIKKISKPNYYERLSKKQNKKTRQKRKLVNMATQIIEIFDRY